MENILDTLQNMWLTFSMIKITDIIDVLIVAWIIYHIIMAFRQSGTRTVLYGIMLIIVVMIFASLLKLNTLTWLLSNVMQIGLIALVIIFQPELRKALEQLGRRNFPKIFLHKAEEHAVDNLIEETVSAAKDLSTSRTGALVIFERVTPLTEEINSGTKINADYNAELLKNIFYEGAPLHDGAVIVQGDRITAAGCMLPLTENQNLSKELGMRHRAGIGMSERSDAVCLIVSEETGAISVAMDGIIRRPLTPETLRALLQRELIQSSEEKKQRFSLKNKIKGGKE